MDFFLRIFLAFSCFELILAHFLGAKLRFHPILYPHKHAQQDQIDAKWLEQSLFSGVRVEEQRSLSLITVNESIKETEKFIIFFQ